MVVSVGEKAPYRRQVRYGKTNESEPLMTRRKAIHSTPKPGGVVGPGSVQALPAYGLSGVRCRGGVIPSQVLVWNVGTCRPDAKGEWQAGSPCKMGHAQIQTSEAEDNPGTQLAQRVGPPRSGVVCALVPARLDDKSRMSREAHVRFCGSVEVKSLRATRPCAESFFHTLKVELVHGESFATRETMRRAVFEYIEVDYNRTSRHSANGNISPMAFETKMVA